MANLVSEVRQVTGLNYKQIGDLIGVHRSTVSRWENVAERPISGPAKRLLENLLADKKADA